MRLTRVELFGFKSFPRRTVFDFPEGITAIVGPNGCGKSNVLDAVRWALGEQSSKSLRGRSTGDLIFSGALEMPPMSVAEVSVHFEGVTDVLPVEEADLVVTRRAYRSGENNYFINGKTVRLKDVLDIFSDTGFGKAAYNLVEQGMVDRLINAKPEERRAVFEEAAGIRRYRTRREEAMRKLDAVRSNMERLVDLLDEYRRQARSLKRQANACKRYGGLRDRLKRLDVGLAWLRWAELDGERAGKLEKLEEARAALEEATLRHEEAAAALAAARADFEAAELSRQDVDDRKLEAFRALSEAEKNSELIREKADAATENLKRLENTVRETGKRIEVRGVELTAAERKSELVARELSEVEAEIRASAEALESAAAELVAAENEAAAVKKTAAELSEAYSSAKSRAENLERQRELLQVKVKQLKKEVETNESSSEAAERDREAATQEVEKLERKLKRIDRALGLCDDKERRLSDEIQAGETAKRRAQAALEAAKSRLASLEELIKSFESYESGAADLMIGERPASITGVLADVIEVESGYEAAVEAALGPAARALLSDGLEGAKAAARTLDERKTGRATFLVPPPNRTPEPQRPRDGILLGRALEFTKVRGNHQDSVGALLGDVLVTKDLDDLVTTAVKYPGSKVVTLRGDYWDGRALLIAGSPGEAASSILGRRAESERLAVSIPRLESDLEELEKAVALGRAAQDKVGKKRAALERTRGAVSGSIKGLMERVAKDTERLKETLAARESAEAELIRLVSEEGEVSRNASVAETEAAAAAAALKKAETDLDKAEAEVTRIRSVLDGLRDGAAEARERYAGVSSALKAVQEEKARLKEEIRQGEAALAEFRTESDRERENAKDLTARLKDAEIKLEEAKARFADVDGQARDRRLVVEEAKARVREAEAKEKERSGETDTTRDLISELEVEIARLTGELNAVNEGVFGRWGVNLDGVSEDERALDAEPEAALAEKEQLERKLAAMGEVNFRAAKEYEKTEARIRIIEEQHDDLTRAEGNLLESIDEIDTKTGKMFTEVFELVRKSFKEIFTDVFDGGQADLRLEAGKDPLEAGVYIYAEPPGKRMRLLSLLSGGEKAMTAIALLFALLESRPAPFVILDEADATLDDVNIERYLRLIRRNIERCQFVLMTHVKRTMTAADSIYGITMEDKGISKVVSLKLDEVTEEYVGEPV